MKARKPPSGEKPGAEQHEIPSEVEKSLIEKLAFEPAAGASMEVVLSADEMDCLRRLTGIQAPEPEPAKAKTSAPARRSRKRTADLQVSDAELEFLRQFGAPEPGRSRSRKRTIDISFTSEEIDFLRKLSGRDIEASHSGPLPVKDKLLTGDLRAGEEVALPVGGPEARWLAEVTSEEYSFVSGEDRRARLELRQKLQAAMRGRGRSQQSR